VSADKLVTITEDELKTLVDASQRHGMLEHDESKMISSIFQLGDTLAREIMVPRIDMFTLDLDTLFSEAIDAVLKSGYSRVPVHDQHMDNIVGILYIKDILKIWREGNLDKFPEEILRPAYFIPEAKKADELLEEMQAEHIHIAIVVDEYGGIAGVVTLEDIVEEIFGENRDEYDQGEEVLFTKINDDEYIFHGRIDLDDFNDIMNSQLPTEEADTLGGLLYCRIGRISRTGEKIQEDNLVLTLEKVIGRRIYKVRA
jgi:CBS domain containing-hemolysin-like protein